MTLKRALNLALALAATGCAQQYQPLLITGIYPAPEATKGVCTITKPSVAQYAGSLNVGLSDRYYMILTVDSLLEDPAEPSNLTPGSNTSVINEIQYTYTTAAGPVGTPVGFPGSETATISFAVKADSADNLVLVDLIGPMAKQALLSVPATAPDEYFTLKVQVELRGQTLANTAVRTNSITFPIDIYSVPFTCSFPQELKPSGPCGNTGQDGSRPSCCTPDPATGFCP